MESRTWLVGWNSRNPTGIGASGWGGEGGGAAAALGTAVSTSMRSVDRAAVSPSAVKINHAVESGHADQPCNLQA